MEQYILRNEVRNSHKKYIIAQFPDNLPEELKDTWLFFATSLRAQRTVTLFDEDIDI